MKHFLPDTTDEHLQKLFDEHRNASKLPAEVWSSAVHIGNVDCAALLVEQGDAQELQRTAVEQEARRQSRQQNKENTRRRTAAERAPRCPPVFSSMVEVAVEELEKFLPKVKGCRMRKEYGPNKRFIVCYPTNQSPFSFSLTWSADGDQLKPALACLRWAWAAHEFLCPDDQCPYDLSRAALDSQAHAVRASGAAAVAVAM